MDNNDLRTVFSPCSESILLEGQIEYVYKNILFLYESCNREKLRKCRIDQNKFKNTIKDKIDIRYFSTNTITSKLQKDGVLDKCVNICKLSFHFNSDIDIANFTNTLYFYASDQLTIEMIRHFRNAFAHNCVKIEGDIITLGDFSSFNDANNRFSKPTMLCRMTLDNFKFLIETVKEMSTIKI